MEKGTVSQRHGTKQVTKEKVLAALGRDKKRPISLIRSDLPLVWGLRKLKRSDLGALS